MRVMLDTNILISALLFPSEQTELFFQTIARRRKFEPAENGRYIAAFQLIVLGRRQPAVVLCVENRQHLTSFQFEEVLPRWIFVRPRQKRSESLRIHEHFNDGRAKILPAKPGSNSRRLAS